MIGDPVERGMVDAQRRALRVQRALQWAADRREEDAELSDRMVLFPPLAWSESYGADGWACAVLPTNADPIGGSWWQGDDGEARQQANAERRLTNLLKLQIRQAKELERRIEAVKGVLQDTAPLLPLLQWEPVGAVLEELPAMIWGVGSTTDGEISRLIRWAYRWEDAHPQLKAFLLAELAEVHAQPSHAGLIDAAILRVLDSDRYPKRVPLDHLQRGALISRYKARYGLGPKEKTPFTFRRLHEGGWRTAEEAAPSAA